MSNHSHQGERLNHSDSPEISSSGGNRTKSGFSRRVFEQITHYGSNRSDSPSRVEEIELKSISGGAASNSEVRTSSEETSIGSQPSPWYNMLMGPVYKVLGRGTESVSNFGGTASQREEFSEKGEVSSDAEGAKPEKPENYEEGLSAFGKEAREYGSKCYAVDSSLEPQRIQEAYDMYLKARCGAGLKFLVLGRKYRDQERNLLPSTERSPSIDQPLIENLGVMDKDFEKKNGSIFSYPYDDWMWITNDAWVLGSMHAKNEFRIISPINTSNFWKSEHDCMTIFAREVKAITSFGYELRKTQFEVVAVCVDKDKAEKATLRALIEKTQEIQSYNGVEEFFRSLPDEVKAKE